jgi:hypothetical protein
MKKIYGYYESIALSNQGEEFACANWWKHSWTANGWEPVMLNRSHAQGSNLYGKLQQKLMLEMQNLPQEMASQVHWIIARFARWCALHAAGGGWMSDYDVVNTKFTNEIADQFETDGTLHINCGNPAFVFYATKEHAGNAIKKFISDPIFGDGKVIDECEILGVKSGLYPVIPFLFHAKEKDGLCRSAIMKNSCE